MPVHDGSRSDQDERLPPPGPERSQRNPEQLVQGSQLTARSMRVQSQQLPAESQVFEDDILCRVSLLSRVRLVTLKDLSVSRPVEFSLYCV